MLKTMAMVFGVVLLVVGALGFVPGVTNSDGLLFGIFHVNTLHNIIHLVSGAAALYAGMTSFSASKMYFQIFGVIYLLVAILGFFYNDADILGVLANNMADIWLHVVIAVVALYLGFATKEEMAEAV